MRRLLAMWSAMGGTPDGHVEVGDGLWLAPLSLSAPRRFSANEKLTTLRPPLTLRSSGSRVRLPALGGPIF